MTTWSDALASLNDACQSTFGEPLIYAAPNSSPVSFTGVMSQIPAGSADQSSMPFVNFTSESITVEVILDGLGFDPVKEAIITDAHGVEYSVFRVVKDRDGMARLHLHRSTVDDD